MSSNYTRDPRDYRYGTTSENVTELQERLVEAGYEIKVDGIFGDKTRKAVLTFEQDLSLTNSMSFTVDRVTMEYLFNGSVLTPPDPPPPVVGLPRGKGMFIRSWKHLGDPDTLRARIQESGVRWVAVLRLWQMDDPDEDNLTNETGGNGHSREDFQAVLSEENCDLWIWGWPIPGREAAFISEMDETAIRWEALGMILDCEGPWVDHSADTLMDLALDTGHTVGVTSYGAPWYHPGIPMNDWARADFGMPQIYESEGTWDQDYPQDSVNAWTQAGFQHVIPASSSFATRDHMESLLRRTPTPDDALIFWDWYNANLREERWEVVSEYQLDAQLTEEQKTAP